MKQLFQMIINLYSCIVSETESDRRTIWNTKYSWDTATAGKYDETAHLNVEQNGASVTDDACGRLRW